MSDEKPNNYFRLFNEIGIVAQLASNRFERILPHGLTLAQFTLLNHCVRLGDGWTPARLAAAFQVTRGTLTSTLKRLEDKGFIFVAPNATDKRSKRVFLTDEGRSAREDAITLAGPALVRATAALSPDEVAVILPLLERLRTWLDANRETG